MEAPLNNNWKNLNRREFVKVAGALSVATSFRNFAAPAQVPGKRGEKTEFQIACMTLPYSAFPLERALSGIRSAGYEYVAWGTTHRDASGKNIPVISPDASPKAARELGTRCRDMGLTPLMMFSGVYPEHDDAVKILTNRLAQAAAAGIPQVLTFGHTEGGKKELWVERFRQLAPLAHDHGVLLVVKQHGGTTGTGRACAEITREVGHASIKVNYDAGNVMDYLNADPLADIQECADEIRSFCIKDHRNFPRDEDCGPGFGEIDHYKLLHRVAFAGRKMPLCCENIFAPLVPRPADPNGIDALARRAREFLDTVIRGLQAP
jgi:sugar phosphate isomerase/epimerase